MADAGVAAFTLRFRDPDTHQLLRDVARAKGVSMSELAEQLVARGLRAEAAELERTLEAALARLRQLRPVDQERVAAATVHAEAHLADPLTARRVGADAPGAAASPATSELEAAGRLARGLTAQPDVGDHGAPAWSGRATGHGSTTGSPVATSGRSPRPRH